MSSLKLTRAFARGWWIVVITIVLAVVAGAIITNRQTPIFTSSAMLVVVPSPTTTDPAEIVRSIETLERRTLVATFARIPTTREMREALRARIPLAGGDIGDYSIRGSVVPSTNIIRIDVDGPDGKTAAAVANAAAQLTAAEGQRLYRVYAMRVMAQATPESRPRHPDPRRNAVIAAVVGAMIGAAGALALDHLRGGGATEAPPT